MLLLDITRPQRFALYSSVTLLRRTDWSALLRTCRSFYPAIGLVEGIFVDLRACFRSRDPLAYGLPARIWKSRHENAALTGKTPNRLLLVRSNE